MKALNISFNKLSHIFFMCCLVTIFIFLLYIKVHSTHTTAPLNDHVLYNLNTNWHYTLTGSCRSSNISLPVHLSLPAGTNIINLERTLTEASPTAGYLLLHSSQQSLHVWIDHTLIYTYNLSSSINFDNHTASAWHFVKLPIDYDFSVPHRLAVQFYAPETKSLQLINNVYIGSQIACIYMLFQTYGFAWLTCLLFFLLGIILLSYSVFSLLNSKHHTPIIYLGLFALCASIWSASESRLLQLLISNREFEYYLNYCLLYILPIPVLFYIKLTYSDQHAKLYDLLIWLFGLNFMYCISLVVFNVQSFANLHLAFEFLLVVALTLCSITFFTALKEQTINKLVITGFLSLIFTAALDLLRIYTGDLIDSSFAFRIGLLIFIVTTSFNFEKHLFEVSSQSTKSHLLETLAFTDTLTGLLNRTAFNETLTKLNQILPSTLPIALVLFDLNNLKKTNDTKGHITGDLLITHTAVLLKTIFLNPNTIYRICGDEFVIILKDIPENTLKHLLQKFQYHLQLHNSIQNPKISINYSYAYYNPMTHTNIQDVLIAADKNMSLAKHSSKLQKQWMN
ncbi:GGDEF domain-containing protein [Cellulosilyticum ruminicola]|uniref:GGDEF domain-containing protein n=1 Tax=Cellulosilyticum ruminicola TaxID=425254 RepID=UPI0006D02A77|nr:GGDEF domain-containing protein [Cellulosilyticum ruminicola]